MKTTKVTSWSEFKQWAERMRCEAKRYVFRGQKDATWSLSTSLSRHLRDNNADPHQWRATELNMYRHFRETLLDLFPGMYDTWEPLDILSLMQHYRVPTRLIDFTYCPYTAAHFAFADATGSSAIFVVDTIAIERHWQKSGAPRYVGPTHANGYLMPEKHNLPPIVTRPNQLNHRIAAQQGCFMLAGRISLEIDDQYISEKLILPRAVAREAGPALKGLRKDHDHLHAEVSAAKDAAMRVEVPTEKPISAVHAAHRS